MANVNYIQEHILFIEYAADNDLTANERALWYGIIHLINKTNSHAEWSEDYITLSNNRLLAYMPFKSEDMLIRVRQQLLNRKDSPISYRKGKKGKNPEYKLNYFSLIRKYAYNQSGNKSDNQSYNQSGNSNLKNSVKSGLDTGFDKPCENMPINKDYKLKPRHININTNQHHLNNDDIIAKLINKFEDEEDVVNQAIELAKGKMYPLAYAEKLLTNWQAQGYKQADSLNVYLSKPRRTTNVAAQNYTQREYSEEEYNIWKPEFEEAL